MSLCPVSVTRPLAGLTDWPVAQWKGQNNETTGSVQYKVQSTNLSLSDVEEGGARGQARLSVQEMRLDNVQTIPPCVSPHLTSLQDSLTGEEFNFSPGQGLAMVNKNNYTLTYSGHGSISSQQEYHSHHHHHTPHSEYCDVTTHYRLQSNLNNSLFTPIKFLPEDICR